MSSQGMLMLVCRPLSEQWTAVCCYLELREWPPDQFLDYLFFASHQALFESTWQDDLLLFDIRQHILLSIIPFSLSINTFPLFLFCLLVLFFQRGEVFSFLVIFAAWPVVMLWSPHFSYLLLSFPLFFNLWSRLLFQHPWSCDSFSLTLPFLSQAFYALPSPSPTDQSWWSEHHQFLQRIFGALSIPINCWIF